MPRWTIRAIASSAAVQSAQAALFQYGTELLAEKRRCPAEDILSAAAHGRIPGADGGEENVTELELQMLFNLLIAAGSETTRNSIAAGVAALVQHPAQWRALQDDHSLLPRAIEEILRWSSSTPYNRRTATRDVEMRLVFEGLLDRFDSIALTGSIEWTRSNKHTGVRHMPVTFVAKREARP